MKTLLALAMSFWLLSCAPSLIVPARVQLQEDLLCRAFRADSLQLLDLFFDRWQRDRMPLARGNRASLTDTQRAVYEVYEDFCNYELATYANAYTGSPFCMIQNEISFAVVDTAKFDDSMARPAFADTIRNFRPAPSSLHARIVYVTPRYDALLENFIKETCPGSGKRAYDHPWPGWPRANFLEQMVQLRASLGGFRFHTLPWIRVRLNGALSQAVVEWSRGNIWGTDLFRFADGKWEHVKSIDWAIE